VQRRTRECSFRQGLFGSDLNVHSIETLRELMITRRLRRYRPLVALLRSGLRHRVMIVADGEEWQRTRDAVNFALKAGVVAADYAPVIQQVTGEAFSRLDNRAAGTEASTGFDISVEPLMRTVTLSILGHLLFGRALPLEEASLMESTLTASTEGNVAGPVAWINRGVGAIFAAFDAGGCQPVIFSRKQRRALDRILAWIGNRIDEVKGTGLRPPLLEQLEVRYAGQSPARQKRSIVAEYAMICVAGIETTASVLTLAIAEIAADDAVRDRVVREARQPPASGLTAQQVAARFPYLHCVFRETLRRHTIVPTLLRETGENYTVTGTHPATASQQAINVPQGATLRYLPVQGHMRRTVWTEPHRFDPCRFVGSLNSEQTLNYIPFGLGPQRCPGHAMATTESILILAEFFRRFELEAKAIANGVPLQRNVIFTTALSQILWGRMVSCSGLAIRLACGAESSRPTANRPQINQYCPTAIVKML
jgi:cytochrome P450